MYVSIAIKKYVSNAARMSNRRGMIKMKVRKAQGLPLNVIIVALIGLVVLVILLAIVSGKMKVFGKKAADCKTKGGECKTKAQCDESTDRFRQIEGTDCDKDNALNVCCLTIF